MSAAPKPRVAVALEYDYKGAPRVTAKGKGEVAANILALAREHGVTVEENPVLAEALSQVELDSEIPEALYRAVAEVLTFVLRARGMLRPKAPAAAD
jgi:flagellar biosynthesis protein